MVFAAHGLVDEFKYDVVPDALDIAVAPGFEGESLALAAALILRELIGSTGGVGIDFIRWTVDNIGPAAIGFPAGDAGGEALIGVGDAPVVLFFKFVLLGIRSWVAPQPELFGEAFTLGVVREDLERPALFIGDDVSDVLVEPDLIGRLQLAAQFLVALFLFF